MTEKQGPEKARPGIGGRIRAFRKKRGLNQPELAAMLGITKNAVTNWEADRTRPGVELMPKLCRALDVSADVLLGLKDDAPPPADEKSLLIGYRELTAPNKIQLRKTLDAILVSQEETRRESFRRDFRRLTGHGIGLAAGFGAPVDGETDTFPLFVRLSRAACRADDVFPVNGHSMEPDFPDGSLVFVERAPEGGLRYGDLVACVVAGVPYVKVYEKNGLRSLNPDYPLITVTDDDDARLLGRVVGRVPETDLATREEETRLLELFPGESR